MNEYDRAFVNAILEKIKVTRQPGVRVIDLDERIRSLGATVQDQSKTPETRTFAYRLLEAELWYRAVHITGIPFGDVPIAYKEAVYALLCQRQPICGVIAR